VIRVARGLLRAMTEAAEDAYPQECCGLLVGREIARGDILVSRIEPSRNLTRASPRTSFEVDPALRLRLMRTLRGGEENIVGHYHSHPDRPATPSAHDAACAWEPELAWLIIAVDRGAAAGVNAFRYDAHAQRFQPLPLVSERNGA
jgi:proteasome lid subunit RPN8/RPN11